MFSSSQASSAALWKDAQPPITEEMKLAAANAIAALVDDSELSDENILPAAFDPRVADAVSKAVKEHIKK